MDPVQTHSKPEDLMLSLAAAVRALRLRGV